MTDSSELNIECSWNCWITPRKATETLNKCRLGIQTDNSIFMKNIFKSRIKTPSPSSPGLGQHRVHKQEDGLLWRQLDAFPDDVHELGHRDVRGQQVLPLVDIHDLWPRHLLQDHLTDHTGSGDYHLHTNNYTAARHRGFTYRNPLWILVAYFGWFCASVF